MNSLFGFISNSCVNTTSHPERVGDFLLTPTRIVFQGKRFVVLKKEEQQFLYESPDSWSHIALRIAAIPGLILTPLGLLIKSLSLFNKQTRQAYAEWTTIASYNYDTIGSAGFLKELFAEIASNPTPYLKREEEIMYPCYRFPPLDLTGRNLDHQTQSKLKSSRRIALENRMIRDLTTRLTDKTQPLRLLSLGTSGFLHEWIFIGHLLKAGFTNIHLELVDSFDTYQSKNFIKFFEQFKEVNISLFKEVRLAGDGPYDAIMAIHFDEVIDYSLSGVRWGDEEDHYGYEEIAAAQQKLAEDGKLYFASNMHGTLVIDAHKKIEEVSGQQSYYTAAIAQHIHDMPPKKESVSIVSGQFNGFYHILFPLVMHLVANDVKSVHLTLVGKNIDFSTYPNAQQTQRMLQGLFLPTHATLECTFVEDEERLDEGKFDYTITSEKGPLRDSLFRTRTNRIGYHMLHDGSLVPTAYLGKRS